ncbi:lipopolysaccharide-induced tumor necrosis factor-alpha factor homolog [Pararge aegeria]|uniref:Jg17158 protein n=1 Tax=Pararge aegeria aegeria TaxID=348720 RepID=A0A8S4RQU4_9NEOP|nr:lipopolysaccharide-induced tumor necrosis factor-alpha factor homolog [Pararge aegeria]CAH2238572.1 jg17158 [Pararge aegeria aegeria]
MDTKMKDLDNNSDAQTNRSQPPPYSGSPEQATVVQPSSANVHGMTIIQGPTVGPTLIVGHNVGPGPTGSYCTTCNQNIVTRVDRVASAKTHLFAALLCVVSGCLCAWIPYVMDSFKTTNHYCPNCGVFIGSHS